MKKLIFISIFILLLLVVSLGYHFYSARSAPAVNKTSLTLDLNFGNNDGSAAPTVYDVSGFGRHATSTAATAPTCNQKFCDFDGTADYMTLAGSGVFPSTSLSIAIKFSPDFASGEAVQRDLFNGTTVFNYSIARDTVGRLRVNSGSSNILTALAADTAANWKVGKENVLVVVAASGNNKMWLNGNLVASGVGTWNVWSFTSMDIGRRPNNTEFFDGKLYYLKVWNRLLTDAEVQNLSADRIITVNSAPKTASSTASLIGWWTMDANDINGTNYFDKSGYNNTATSTDSPTIVAGKIKQAVNLNGSSQLLDIAHQANLNSYPITVSAWFKTTTASGALVNKYLPGSTNGWQLFFSVGKLCGWYWKDGDTYIDSGGCGQVGVSATPYLNNQWHLATLVVDSSGGKLYVDGVSKITNSWTGTAGAMTATNDVKIGNYPGDSYFNGSIDDVRIYNRALSAQEVANLYSAAKVKYASAPPRIGLVGYWNMDSADISGINYYDKSGNNNTATSTGSPTVAAGKINQAVGFDGSSNYLSAADSPSLSPITTMTVSLWVKRVDGNQRMLINKWDGGSQNSWDFQVYNSPNSILAVIAGSLSDPGNIYAATPVNSLLPDSKFHNVVWVYNGAGADNPSKLKIYIDSILQSTGYVGTIPTSLTDSTTNISIGRRPNSVSSFNFNSSIDDVRIYNRALSAAEIANLYQSGAINYVR